MSIDKYKTIWLFPGQGAQYPGMAIDFLNSGNPAVRELFDCASAVCGQDMEALLRDSDEESLKRTDVSQPAVSLANLAAAAFLEGLGYKAVCCAGFSLGEYAALAQAGVISIKDCMSLVHARGRAMQAAINNLNAGLGASSAPGMAAVTGLAPDQIEALITQWRNSGLKGLYAANINSKKQVAVSGTAAALAEAEKRFTDAGARRFIRLQVAGPFHSPLIAEAAESFRPFLDTIEFRDPVIPVFSNVTGKIISRGAEAKKLAFDHITNPVRWTEEEQALINYADALDGGISVCLEAGPGSVLQNLWRAADSTIPCYAAGTIEDISSIGK